LSEKKEEKNFSQKLVIFPLSQVKLFVLSFLLFHSRKSLALQEVFKFVKNDFAFEEL
jgi:hypothetical protein